MSVRKRKPNDADYKAMLLRLMPLGEIDAWLADHPPPAVWGHGKYRYAWQELILSERLVFRSVRNEHS